MIVDHVYFHFIILTVLNHNAYFIKRIPRLAEANIRHIGEYVLIIVNWLAHYSIPILPRLKPHNAIDGWGVARSV